MVEIVGKYEKKLKDMDDKENETLKKIESVPKIKAMIAMR